MSDGMHVPLTRPKISRLTTNQNQIINKHTLKASINYIRNVTLVTDGGCRGNPGPGAIGVMILGEGNTLLYEHSACIGHTTNNRAEYHALITGLDLCAKFTRHKVLCLLDSELIVRQMNGTYCLKNDELRTLFRKVKEYAVPFEEVIYQFTKRTSPLIKKVDRLVSNAFESRTVSKNYVSTSFN